jgi:hypothetical protein
MWIKKVKLESYLQDDNFTSVRESNYRVRIWKKNKSTHALFCSVCILGDSNSNCLDVDWESKIESVLQVDNFIGLV